MDIGSLLFMLALAGQVKSQPAEAADAEQHEADPDAAIEKADESPVADKKAASRGAAKNATEQAGDNQDADNQNALEPVHDVQTRPGTAESLLQWLADGDVALEGKRVALVDLLSRVYDRSQQAMIVAGYWKLSAAAAEYRIAADESLRLEQLLPPADASGQHASDPLLEARLASAGARIREAELAVLSQQFAMAEPMRLPANEPLPLASDLPHAGAYRTYFQERYSRVAPPRSHLIDRTLPLLHRSVELRAAAAISAADSADAEAEAYHAGQLDLLSAIDSVAELSRQRRAFVAAIRDYNLDIAEYALSVAPATLTSSQLVGMLIGPPPSPSPGAGDSRKQIATAPGGIKQARFDAPTNGLQRAAGTPTLAPPRGASDAQRRDSPAGGPPGGGAPGARRRPPNNPSNNPSGDQSGQTKPVIKSTGPAATQSRNDVGRRHVAAKPPYDIAQDDVSGEGTQPDETPIAADTSGPPAEQRLYGALADLSPVKRAQELSATLHWDGEVTPEQGTAISLVDALASTPGLDKPALIDAYWRGRERVAAAEVIRQEAALLKSLEAAVLSLHTQPGGAEAMLRLHVAQLSADAALQESAIGVLAAQFNLAQLMRRSLDGPWPWPTTPPHAGGYRLKLDEQSGTVQQSSLVRQAGKAIPVRHDVLQQRAAAVVAADTSRVERALGVESGQGRVSDAVASVRELSNETLAFLDAQTQYNIQFADYVMAVAPPGTPDVTLAGVLVVNSNAVNQRK